jgi:hypothetical protein
MLSTQQSVEACGKAVELSTYASDATTATTFDACRAIMVNVAGTYKLYFRNAPSTACTMILVAGLVYPFSLVKLTDTDDTVCASNAIHVLY